MKIALAVLAFNLCALAPALATAPAAPAAVKPFHAQYATSRNGNELGRTTLDLVDNGDGTWTLRSETYGTSGLARLAGVHVVETSRFRWNDGRPEALVYDYRQDAAFKSKTRHADFDWKRGRVHVTEGNDDFHYATTPGLIDRQTVTLAIANDLLHGAATFDYKVAVKDRIEDVRYARTANETLKVPAGELETVAMQREGDAGADRKRGARSWFARSLGWIPAQIQQTVKKGDTITLKLVSTKR